MAIQTTLTLSSDQNGTARVTAGTFVGAVGRSVTVEARSNDPARFVFDKWEIYKTGVERLKDHSYVSFRKESTLAVCTPEAQAEAVQLSQTLFTFGQFGCTDCVVYLDQFGNSLAPAGYWARGNNTYFVTNFEGKVSTGTCQQEPPATEGTCYDVKVRLSESGKLGTVFYRLPGSTTNQSLTVSSTLPTSICSIITPFTQETTIIEIISKGTACAFNNACSAPTGSVPPPPPSGGGSTLLPPPSDSTTPGDRGGTGGDGTLL